MTGWSGLRSPTAKHEDDAVLERRQGGAFRRERCSSTGRASRGVRGMSSCKQQVISLLVAENERTKCADCGQRTVMEKTQSITEYTRRAGTQGMIASRLRRATAKWSPQRW